MVLRKNKSNSNSLPPTKVQRVAQIHNEIQNTFSNKQYMEIISLDILKAYDSAWRLLIIS